MDAHTRAARFIFRFAGNIYLGEFEHTRPRRPIHLHVAHPRCRAGARKSGTIGVKMQKPRRTRLASPRAQTHV